MKTQPNISFLFASPQNVDRIVSAHKACRKTGSIFVIDIYTAFVMHKLSEISKNLPQYDWTDIRVKFFKDHVDKLAKSGRKDLLVEFNTRKIKVDKINQESSKVLMMLKDNSIFPRIINRLENVKGSTLIYSMWSGYLTEKFKSYCKMKGIEIKHIHTSGHATMRDLKRFTSAINPGVVIPIHTCHADAFAELSQSVKILQNGEIFTLN